MQSENLIAGHDKREITAIKSQVAGPQKHHLPGVPEGIFFWQAHGSIFFL